VCLGECAARVSEEEYQKGKTRCGAKNCSNKGKPFQKETNACQCECNGNCN